MFYKILLKLMRTYCVSVTNHF